MTNVSPIENTNTSNNNTDSMLTNNGNGTSNNGAPGKWAKKNKNRRRNKNNKNNNKSVGSKSSDYQLDDNNRPRSNSINGHKRIHDNDDNNDVSPYKKQRRKSTDTQYTHKRSHEILYVIFFALGMCITLPLLFTTFSYISCGGRSGVDSMVDLVLIEKARGGDDSIVDMMKILKNKTSNDSDKAQKGNEQEVEPITIDIHESMCHVSFIAIGNFIHYLPYAQFLAYSNPFSSRVTNDLTETTTKQEEKQVKKGIFKRIVSRHKKRHIESEDQHNHQESAASEEIDRKHPIRHILEGASIFSQHRKQKKLERKEKKRKKKELKKKGKQASADKEVVEIDWKKWKYAMSGKSAFVLFYLVYSSVSYEV